MANTDISQTTITDMKNLVDDFAIDNPTLESPGASKETYYLNKNFQTNLAYYQQIPEYKKAVDTFATWVLGNGVYGADVETQVILDHITGNGKDTINSIFWNMFVVEKFNGNSYSEVIRDPETGILINLKPLNPERVIHVFDEKGMLIGYDYTQSKGIKIRLKPEKVFHLVNDRIGDSMTGTAACDSIKWVIDARKEAMNDWRRISHRATIRILYVEEDDTTKLANMKRDYADAINKGELLILPVKVGDAQFQDLTLPPYDAFLAWISYLENFFYQAVGIPKTISGGTQGSTEAGSKVGMVVFDPIYLREITDFQRDVWQQLGLRISLIKQNSMMDNVQEDQQKNTGQTGFQKNDTTIGSGKA